MDKISNKTTPKTHNNKNRISTIKLIKSNRVILLSKNLLYIAFLFISNPNKSPENS